MRLALPDSAGMLSVGMYKSLIHQQAPESRGVLMQVLDS
jgi:hypothetical protein